MDIVLREATSVYQRADLSQQILGDIKHLLDMASYYVDEEDQEVTQIVELTKMLTEALEREMQGQKAFTGPLEQVR